MTRKSVELILKSQVEAQLREQGEHVDLRMDDDLLLEGLDSIGFLRLVDFIEDEFKLDVPPIDVTVEQFGSIQRIADYLHGRSPG